MTQEILLIDDDGVANFINSKILEKEFAGISITIFKEGESALEYIQKKPKVNFLVFLDLNMPVMNGWEFLEELKSSKCKYNLQIFILSSSLDKNEIEKATSYNEVVTYMVKPLTIEQVKEKVKF